MISVYGRAQIAAALHAERLPQPSVVRPWGFQQQEINCIVRDDRYVLVKRMGNHWTEFSLGDATGTRPLLHFGRIRNWGEAAVAGCLRPTWRGDNANTAC